MLHLRISCKFIYIHCYYIQYEIFLNSPLIRNGDYFKLFKLKQQQPTSPPNNNDNKPPTPSKQAVLLFVLKMLKFVIKEKVDYNKL